MLALLGAAQLSSGWVCGLQPGEPLIPQWPCGIFPDVYHFPWLPIKIQDLKATDLDARIK